jgi:hypothetical protein
MSALSASFASFLARLLDDLLQCAEAYASLADPQLPMAQRDAQEGFLLRKGSEQSVYMQ